MTALDPLVRLLVRVLSEQQPSRVHQPIPINELMDSLVPYRLVRRELGVDSAEDYETMLLRLCAGEGNFVEAEPATQTALLAELKNSLPDLALLRVHGDSQVVLRGDPLMTAKAIRPEERYAPPGEPPTIAPEAEPVDVQAEEPAPVEVVHEAPRAEEPADPGGTSRRCPLCGGPLPPRMTINFCPHCGMGQDIGECRACGADMDAGWRYCVSCGEEAPGELS